MNYSNHNLRTDLQERKNRLYRAPYEQFGHQLKYFFKNIDSNRQLNALITEANNKYHYPEDQLENYKEQLQQGVEFSFESETDQAAFCYQFLNHLFIDWNTYNIHNYTLFVARDFEQQKSNIVEEYISPILYFFHDKLDKSNSVLFLYFSSK